MPVTTRRSTRATATQSVDDVKDEKIHKSRKKNVSKKSTAVLEVPPDKDEADTSMATTTTTIQPDTKNDDDQHAESETLMCVEEEMEQTPVIKTEALPISSHSGGGDSGIDKEEIPCSATNENLYSATVQRGVLEVYKKETFVRKQIKGKPKSGRKWKTEQTARFSDIRKDKPLRSSWQLKMAQRAEKLSIRKYQQELQEARQQERELKRKRREEHKKRREENQRKSEVVQVIHNTAKLKRMKKKQLRYIEKR